MRGLNYHHLYYFWVTARLGSLRAAAQRLHLAPQTMSDQIKLLEERLNHPLFERQGRRLVLTVEGHQAFAYASRMFAIGEELATLLLPPHYRTVVAFGVMALLLLLRPQGLFGAKWVRK